MAQLASDFLAGVQGVIAGLKSGMTPVNLATKNIQTYVQSARYHAEASPEIDEAAGRLLRATLDYQSNYNLADVVTSVAARDEAMTRLTEMLKAYNALAELIRKAEPSSVARALGE